MKIEFNGRIKWDKEDGGMARIATIDDMVGGSDPDRGLFVRVQSWDETKEHLLAKKLTGKKVKITIEVLSITPRLKTEGLVTH